MRVFVTSVGHTGTWFTLRFLEQLVPPIVEWYSIVDGKLNVPDQAILHAHIYVSSAMSPIDTPTINPWAISTLCGLFKTVVPLRDPLASILTREARHPELRHHLIVDGFCFLAEHIDGLPNVKFLPIDTECDRAQLLKDVLDHCGICSDSAFVDRYAADWPVHNPTPQNKFKQAYEARHSSGGMKALIDMLGPKSEEVEYLRSKDSLLKPFLEKHGYYGLLP